MKQKILEALAESERTGKSAYDHDIEILVKVFLNYEGVSDLYTIYVVYRCEILCISESTDIVKALRLCAERVKDMHP